MKPNELDALIDDWIEGCLGAEDAARLSAHLLESPDARARYWEVASVHGLLEQSLQQASLRVITGQETPAQGSIVRWFHWRPLAAAAAGLAFGILSASIVWAYAVPVANRVVNRTITVLSESFENPQFTSKRRFPSDANQWSGDMLSPVGAEAEVTPLQGERMMRLTPSPNRNLSYAWRIVDIADFPELAHSETRRIEVSGAFNTSGPVAAQRYQVRLAAFSQEPADVREIWNNEPVLFDTVLQHVGRNVKTKPDEQGWQTVQAIMDIPQGTRSIVISLAAGEADPAQSQAMHYVDDVQARFVIAQGPVE